MDQSYQLSLKRRFERNLRITPGCWFITTRRGAYPIMRVRGKGWTMSRAAYELYVGPTEDIIERGVRAICHRCDNPRCVNPDHLFIGTYSENMRDMQHKGRARYACGTKNPSAKLNEAKVRTILVDSRTQRAIAHEYGVDQSVISDIKTRKIWRHVNV